MQLMNLGNCPNGAILAKTVYQNDVILLSEGSELNEGKIKLLLRRGIQQVYIEPISNDVESTGEISGELNPQPVAQEGSQPVFGVLERIKNSFHKAKAEESKEKTIQPKPQQVEKQKSQSVYTNPMQVAELGVIIDFGVSKQSSVSREALLDILHNFLDNLEQINDYRVVYVHKSLESPTEINNFNYNIYNQAEKNEQHRVFRSFGQKVYVQYHGNIQLDEFKDLYWYKNKDGLYCLSVSSLGKRKDNRKSSLFLGKSTANTGEIVKEAASQLELL